MALHEEIVAGLRPGVHPTLERVYPKSQFYLASRFLVSLVSISLSLGSLYLVLIKLQLVDALQLPTTFWDEAYDPKVCYCIAFASICSFRGVLLYLLGLAI